MHLVTDVFGEEKWSRSGFGPGNCILVGDLLVALSGVCVSGEDHLSQRVDGEASLHAVARLQKYLRADLVDRPPIAEQEFATVPLTGEHAQEAKRLLWNDRPYRPLVDVSSQIH